MMQVAIGLGSNLGERSTHLRAALCLLAQQPGTDIVAISDVYETEPWGDTDQPAFLNAAILLETSLAPEAMLDMIKQIEQQIGRTQSRRWGPREIDLDILFHGDEVRTSPQLTIPHPHMFERGFVLVPLRDIISTDMICGRSVSQVIATLKDPMPVRDPAASILFQSTVLAAPNWIASACTCISNI